MARWSDPMKLSDHIYFEAYLKAPGCYEIGFNRGGVFAGQYVGRTKNLSRRMGEYMDPTKCHNPHILAKVTGRRNNLYFRVLRTPRYHGLEARMQYRYGVGHEGYRWNKRIEWSYLEA